MKKHLLVSILGVFIYSSAFCSETEQFIISYETLNNSDKVDFFRIAKGTIVTTKEIDNYKFQALIVCGILSSSLKYEVLSGNNTWQIKIPPHQKVSLKLVCYCMNKGAEPPKTINGIAVSIILIDKKKRENFCRSQDDAHSEIEKSHTTLLNISIDYEDKERYDETDNICRNLIYGALKKAMYDELNFSEIYNLKINGISFDKTSPNPLEKICKLKTGDTLSISTDKNVEVEMIFIVNVSNILLNDQKIHLECEGKPTNQFIDIFNEKKR